MTSKDIVLNAMRNQGIADALNLHGRAADMDGTSIIAEEVKIPAFDPKKDYSDWPVGSPVTDEEQVWTLIQPYNAAHYDGRPSSLRALWGLCHTKDPANAKPWVDALGTSGMYMKDECYKDGDVVYRALQDNLVHDAAVLPSAWEVCS